MDPGGPFLDEWNKDSGGTVLCDEEHTTTAVVVCAFDDPHKPHGAGSRRVPSVVHRSEKMAFIHFNNDTLTAQNQVAVLYHLFEREVNDILEALTVVLPRVDRDRRVRHYVTHLLTLHKHGHHKDELADVLET